MKIEVPKVITRLEKLQNSTKNLSWGHSLNEDQLWVLCCGHSYYRKTLTLTLREHKGSTEFAVCSDDCDGEYAPLCLGSEDEVVSSVIEHLKEVFPERRV